MKRNSINYLAEAKVDNYTSWGTVVTGVGYHFIEPNSFYPIKGHPKDYYFNKLKGRVLNDYAIVYISQGKGKFTSSESGEKKLNQGDLIILSPNQWHNYFPDSSTGWDEYWVTFRGDFFSNAIKSIHKVQNPIIQVGLSDEIVSLFHQMQKYAESDMEASQHLMSGILHHLIGYVHFNSIVKHYKVGKDFENIQKAKIIMRKKVYEKIKPEEIAASINMSYSNFRKVFKQHTQISPHQYILNLKIEKIKDLIGNTDMLIQEIALKMGFESSDYFSYFFKSKIGSTPLEYRKEIEEQRKKAGYVQ
jgi:AraC-like DNA-binding protein